MNPFNNESERLETVNHTLIDYTDGTAKQRFTTPAGAPEYEKFTTKKYTA